MKRESGSSLPSGGGEPIGTCDGRRRRHSWTNCLRPLGRTLLSSHLLFSWLQSGLFEQIHRDRDRGSAGVALSDRPGPKRFQDEKNGPVGHRSCGKRRTRGYGYEGHRQTRNSACGAATRRFGEHMVPEIGVRASGYWEFPLRSHHSGFFGRYRDSPAIRQSSLGSVCILGEQQQPGGLPLGDRLKR